MKRTLSQVDFLTSNENDIPYCPKGLVDRQGLTMPTMLITSLDYINRLHHQITSTITPIFYVI